ncbi:EamA family transporter [Leptothoe sp. ISB3NOV94-8A]|uniref:EamA family transporter n=2 Tax=Cyanobacteriota TaxID=1117 RepID=A0A6M0REM7_9CYAN|nr:EamA family transporter [Adonisia turfae]MDV3353135.1 EamA family transporter [Leptothoe sp. LEGE 181152]NEZ54655.1 EamA family transporter [Adonisia turfae CCMR0081]
MKSLADRIPAPTLVILAGVTVQLGSALAKSVFELAGPLGTVFLRVALSAVLLFVLWRPGWQATRKHWPLVMAYGGVLTLMNTSFYLAIDRIPLGVAVAIEFIGPLGLAVIKSRRWLDVVWVTLAALGIILLAPLQGSGLDPLGLGFAGLAAMAWAGYILLAAATGNVVAGIEGLAWAMVFGTCILTPIGISAAGTALLDGRLLVTGLAVAALSSATYALELVALRRIPVNVFGVLLSVEPMLAAASGFLVLGETLTVRSLIAIVLISIAAAGSARYGVPVKD